MKILHLPIKRQFFDLIYQNLKPIEFREFKKYWVDRLVCEIFKGFGVLELQKDRPYKVFDEIHITNGYNPDRDPFMRAEHLGTSLEYVKFPGTKKYGHCFLIKIGEILEVKNYE